MDYHKLSQQYKNVLRRAYRRAIETGSNEVKNMHIFTVLKSAKGSIAFELMHKLGLTTLEDNTSQSIISKDELNEHDDMGDICLSEETKEIIRNSVAIAALKEHRYVGTEHLLLSLVSNDKQLIMRMLGNKETDINNLSRQLDAVMHNTNKFDELTFGFLPDDIQDDEHFSPATRQPGKAKNSNRKNERMLDYVATDITRIDFQKNINPVIGRDDEIERIVQILARRDKNNPVLIGEPGVGKTAIVEGLAKRITEGNVPDILLNKKIYNLDISLLIAGAMYRGEFESRLKQLIDEIREDHSVIVFIDELHTIVGAGSATGSLDAANILKPALARGEVRMIGATTFSEYKQHIEPDSALDRRLQAIMVSEPTPSESINILMGIKSAYEKHHGVAINEDAIKAAVNLSHRYLSEKFLPDKAIDLIDEAAAHVRVKRVPHKAYRERKKYEQELEYVIEQKNKAVEEENFPEALRLKEQERRLYSLLEESEDVFDAPKLRGSIGEQDIAKLISRMTGVPIGNLVAREARRVRNLEKHLSKHIVGQETALRTIAQAIKRSKTGLQNPNRPLSSFMFLGPSGVGKTETAKVLAKEVFNDEKSLIRFDMSEFTERFNISRLLGSPAGYVGYKEGGQLTEAVRRRPYSVVLFDEIEKAHPDIFNILLQVLDEGVISDASGKRVDFRNTIIILTSNIGLKDFSHIAEIGFSESTKDTAKNKESSAERAQIKEKVLVAVRNKFRPEFLNRLDNTIVFDPLTIKHVQKIVTFNIQELYKHLAERDIKLNMDTKLIRNIAEQSFNPQEGARSVRRVLQDKVLSPIADKLLDGSITQNDTVTLTLDKDNNLSFYVENNN